MKLSIFSLTLASHLKKPTEEVLQRYLKCMTNAESVRTLRAAAFRSLSVWGEDRAAAARVRLPLRSLTFEHGEAGGVSAALRDLGEAEDNFYVSDDERSIAIVDLADSGDKRLAADLFMALLKDLSELMGSSLDGSDEGCPAPDVDDVPLMAPSGSEESRRLEAKLLAFERDLDATMSKLRRNLMVIRLLGLMSEDDKLQEGLMKDSEQLLDFICLTLQRGAVACGKRVERRERRKEEGKEGEGEEEGSQMLEIQSLTMALGLLNVKVTGPDVKVSEWERLQGSLDDLRVLSGLYEEERVREQARKLRQLIATHGVILESKDRIRDQGSGRPVEDDKKALPGSTYRIGQKSVEFFFLPSIS